MKLFNLPDLGEGLPDAAIHQWHVEVGQEVQMDQLLVTLETAKATVDLLAPFTGKILKLFGANDDSIATGSPLVGFEGEEYIIRESTGGIVGKIEHGQNVLATPTFALDRSKCTITPAARTLARKLNVDLKDLSTSNNCITPEDVQRYANSKNSQLLTGTRLAMALNIQRSLSAVVPVTSSDEVDIHTWKPKTDMTIRIVRAIVFACQQVPILNAHFDHKAMCYSLNEQVNIGIAVHSEQGLFMPVLQNVANQNSDDLRNAINLFKQKADSKRFTKDDLNGATILLSNFGMLGVRYATPIIVPPTVAIIGIGKTFEKVTLVNGNIELHRILPVMLTINHLLISGGEASKFLKILIQHLEATE